MSYQIILIYRRFICYTDRNYFERLMTMEKRVPLYFLTGFLGSGKTTVLKYLLTKLQGQKVGVIQNEFGKLSIDGDVLRDDDIKMIELTRGSIFCSCLQLSFVEALSEIAKMDLDLVFVESSGWGDPSNAGEIMEAVEVLSPNYYDYRGTICLVDGIHYAQQLGQTETIDRQVQYAQIVLLTKTDLMTPEEIERTSALIREKNGDVRIVPIANGVIPENFLEDDWVLTEKPAARETTNTEENKPKTISLSYEGQMPLDTLLSILEAASVDTFRIKGFCHTDEGWKKIDGVEQTIDVCETEPLESSQLVLISKVGPKMIRTIDTVWKEKSDHPMKLKN